MRALCVGCSCRQCWWPLRRAHRREHRAPSAQRPEREKQDGEASHYDGPDDEDDEARSAPAERAHQAAASRQLNTMAALEALLLRLCTRLGDRHATLALERSFERIAWSRRACARGVMCSIGGGGGHRTSRHGPDAHARRQHAGRWDVLLCSKEPWLLLSYLPGLCAQTPRLGSDACAEQQWPDRAIIGAAAAGGRRAGAGACSGTCAARQEQRFGTPGAQQLEADVTAVQRGAGHAGAAPCAGPPRGHPTPQPEARTLARLHVRVQRHR